MSSQETATSAKELKDTLWKAADKLRGSMAASQYKDVVLGLVFLKYVSDAFEERREALRAEFADEDADYIEFLVREHLTMSMVAQKQDISDPEVIENFAKKVGTMERLVSLYLLTVCDIRATGPKIWNAWKAQLLEDLFYSTARFLKGKGIDRDLLVSRRRKDALRLTRFSPGRRTRRRARRTERTF